MAEPMDPTRRALFLCAVNHMGETSREGMAIATALDLPHPIRIKHLAVALKQEGQDPAEFYPWLADLFPRSVYG